MKRKTKDEQDIAKLLRGLGERLDLITTRLDLLVSLSLDSLPDESFRKPREFNAKLERLDCMSRIKLRPMDAGRIFGRPSRDVSSRRLEIEAKRKKKASR